MTRKTDTEDILNSLDGIRRAEPGPFLYDRIRSRIGAAEELYAPSKWVWLAAACFTALLLLNLQALKKSGGRDSMAVIAEHYQLVNTNAFSYGPHE